jgi:hypothetical protein
MIPVLGDHTLTRRWTEGTAGLDSILAYSAVCAEVSIPFRCLATRAKLHRTSAMGDARASRNKPLAASCCRRQAKGRVGVTGFGALANAIIQPLPGSSRR